MRKKYYAVCYAHVCRWEQAGSESEAARLAFGLVDAERMTVREFPGNPKYMPVYRRSAWLTELFQRHKEKTGNEIK